MEKKLRLAKKTRKVMKKNIVNLIKATGAEPKDIMMELDSETANSFGCMMEIYKDMMELAIARAEAMDVMYQTILELKNEIKRTGV